MRKLTIFTMLIIGITLLNSCQSHKKGENKLIVNIENKAYDSLNLAVILNDFSPVIIKGESEDNKKWTFVFPDSIYERQFWAIISVPRDDKYLHDLAYFPENNTDSLNYYNFS